MGSVTRSKSNNITSPNGNSLAIFVDGESGVMQVKDVRGNVQDITDFIPVPAPQQTGETGQVAFFDGTTTQTGDNSLFWDNTDNRLGIGTNTPSTSLDVLGALTLRKTSENEQTILTINRFNSVPMFKLDISGVNENQLFLRNDNNQNIITFVRSGGVIVQGSLYSNTELGIGRSIGNYLSKFLSTDAYGSFYELQTNIEGVGWGSLLQWNRSRTYFNILSNNVGIGTTSPQAKLDVRAQGALSTDIAFRVRNSADTDDLMIVRGNNSIGFGISASGNAGQFDFGGVNAPQIRLNGYYGNATIQAGAGLFINNNLPPQRTFFQMSGTTVMSITRGNNILIGGTTDDASAILNLDSTTQGFLPPRMTTAQRLAIATPAVGLCVYCTDATEGLYINKSTGWTFIG